MVGAHVLWVCRGILGGDGEAFKAQDDTFLAQFLTQVDPAAAKGPFDPFWNESRAPEVPLFPILPFLIPGPFPGHRPPQLVVQSH